MGTHGRNAITDKDGNHYCFEQSMDGHDACSDFMIEFLEKRNYPQHPTMSNDVDECDQGTNFCHIDYKRKIFYCGQEDPEDILNMPIEEFMDEYGYCSEDIDDIERMLLFARTCLDTKKLRISQGWRFLFNVVKCPHEYDCYNAIPAEIDDFLNNTVKYRLWSRSADYRVTHIFENSLICVNEDILRYVYYDQNEDVIISEYCIKLTSLDIEFFKKENLTDGKVLVYLKNLSENYSEINSGDELLTFLNKVCKS